MLARATGSLKIPLSLTAQIGEENKYTAEATGFAINGSAVGVNIDDMIAQTESTANITVGNEIYGEATTLNVTALNKASRNAFMRNNAYSLVAMPMTSRLIPKPMITPQSRLAKFKIK